MKRTVIDDFQEEVINKVKEEFIIKMLKRGKGDEEITELLEITIKELKEIKKKIFKL